MNDQGGNCGRGERNLRDLAHFASNNYSSRHATTPPLPPPTQTSGEAASLDAQILYSLDKHAVQPLHGPGGRIMDRGRSRTQHPAEGTFARMLPRRATLRRQDDRHLPSRRSGAGRRWQSGHRLLRTDQGSTPRCRTNVYRSLTPRTARRSLSARCPPATTHSMRRRTVNIHTASAMRRGRQTAKRSPLMSTA
jgi:hypothetical protein